jgi:hypothetical protein
VNYVSPPIEQYLKFKNRCSLMDKAWASYMNGQCIMLLYYFPVVIFIYFTAVHHIQHINVDDGS